MTDDELAAINFRDLEGRIADRSIDDAFDLIDRWLAVRVDDDQLREVVLALAAIARMSMNRHEPQRHPRRAPRYDPHDPSAWIR